MFDYLLELCPLHQITSMFNQDEVQKLVTEVSWEFEQKSISSGL